MWILLRTFLPYALIGAVSLLGMGGVYWYIRQQGVAAEREAQFMAQIEAYKAEVAKSVAVSKGLEKKLADSRKALAKLNERASDEVRNVPVYDDCIVPPSGVWIINDAIAGVTKPGPR